MTLNDDLKKPCRTPNAAGVTHIPAWKYEAVRRCILEALTEAPEAGVTFKELRLATRDKMGQEALEILGSWGWHFTTVKLEMEGAGEISRLKGQSPQKIVLGSVL